MKLRRQLMGLALALTLGGLAVGCSSQKDMTPNEEIVTDNVEETDKEENEEVKEEVKEEQLEEVKPETETEVKEDTEVKEEIKEEVKLEETKPEVKPEVSKPEAKPEVKPEVSKPVAKPEASKPQTKPEANKPVVKPEANKPVVKPDASKPETKPEAKPEVKPEEVTLTAGEVVDKITANIETPANMNMDTQMFADTYGIDTALLKSYQVNMPMMVVHASEIAVFELKDAKDASKVLSGINKRYEQMYETWSTYLPDQFELVKNYKTAQKGNYVLFVISDEASTIVSNFNSTIK